VLDPPPSTPLPLSAASRIPLSTLCHRRRRRHRRHGSCHSFQPFYPCTNPAFSPVPPSHPPCLCYHPLSPFLSRSPLRAPLIIVSPSLAAHSLPLHPSSPLCPSFPYSYHLLLFLLLLLLFTRLSHHHPLARCCSPFYPYTSPTLHPVQRSTATLGKPWKIQRRAPNFTVAYMYVYICVCMHICYTCVCRWHTQAGVACSYRVFWNRGRFLFLKDL